MVAASELRRFARESARILAAERDLAAFELYCSSADQFVMRLNFTSHIPCNGVEEAKSLSTNGFALRIVSRHDPQAVGIGIGTGRFDSDTLREALDRARASSVSDPDFPGLPSRPRRLTIHRPSSDSGRSLSRIEGGRLTAAAWKIIEGAADALDRMPAISAADGVIIGGDLSVWRDRMVLVSSEFSDLREDESAWFSASVTALVEKLGAKGTASALGRSGAEMATQTPGLGPRAVESAVQLGRGVRPRSGRYRVIFGPQPVAEILCYMVIPSLTAAAFHAASSAYQGRFGDIVMDPRLNLYDDPRFRVGAIRRAVTCEGMPARRTSLVRDGRLTGLLSTVYDDHRLATDRDRAEKLGPHAPEKVSFNAHSGYRLGEGGSRRFDSTPPAAVATNVVMRARDGKSSRALVETVRDGIYIGRVWYTYPINGQRAGDFTCTISGDSYLIRDGKLAGAIAPNCLRVNANLSEVFDAPIGCGRAIRPALVWGSPEVFYVPEIAVADINLAEIGE
jgi:predicted Zn-dependent protease